MIQRDFPRLWWITGQTGIGTTNISVAIWVVTGKWGTWKEHFRLHFLNGDCVEMYIKQQILHTLKIDSHIQLTVIRNVLLAQCQTVYDLRGGRKMILIRESWHLCMHVSLRGTHQRNFDNTIHQWMQTSSRQEYEYCHVSKSSRHESPAFH